MSIYNHLPLIFLIALLSVSSVVAFGAGNIPSYGYLENKAYRHGDLGNALAELTMRHASGFLSRSTKFSRLMIKQVYFGNWLRDYSQAIDIGTLGRGIKLGTLRMLVWALGFASFGYATAEFEVTNDRLGAYRPEEHIDNPKGYGEGEDARKHDPRLRGPVDPRELEIDPRSGMKNYIANEQGGWSTSAGYVRWSLERCIEFGRKYESGKRNEDLYEAFRLLGQSLHTLEDFSAHSNYCELTLIELGYRGVFPHVGAQTQIYLNGKSVFPLVTGTFGGLDFVHSLLGEASDHILQMSVDNISQTGMNDLGSKMKEAKTGGNDAILRTLINQIPGQGSDLNRQLNQIQQESERASASGDFADMDPEELAAKIFPILAFRDKVMKVIENTIDRARLSSLVEKISDSLAIYVLSQLDPFIHPLITHITAKLGEGSSLVISNEDQYAVWNNSRSSDPTHSMLSKDHFSTYLNEPAGRVAIAIVKYTVERVTKAWSDNSINPRDITNDALRAFHHPAMRDARNELQSQMFETIREWIGNMDNAGRRRVLEGLTSEGVRTGLNHDPSRSSKTAGKSAGHSCGGPAAPPTYGRPSMPLTNDSKYGTSQNEYTDSNAGKSTNYYHNGGPASSGNVYSGTAAFGQQSSSNDPSDAPYPRTSYNASADHAPRYSQSDEYLVPAYAPPSGPPPRRATFEDAPLFRPPPGPPPSSEYPGGPYCSSLGPPPGFAGQMDLNEQFYQLNMAIPDPTRPGGRDYNYGDGNKQREMPNI
ncbi:hypothetical protein NEOLI_000824 [Neolecta irregularis DAH-3]|uniref:Het-C-domain-containing protein n=1 Tax=Neolecta irregularis (strain DAH-3) TaxID=1198029 RepID=A0A1U7LRJ8_NEOID|nr:hypothetical protein NEOLI_000824 [Neolecta irregularis DAH-3]|eukprot:OLL25248.1 hypothetical protein NEOLI_000824 [Neolecta irregularis DAH-3]